MPFALTLRANRDAAMALMADALKVHSSRQHACARAPHGGRERARERDTCLHEGEGHVSARGRGTRARTLARSHARTLVRARLPPRGALTAGRGGGQVIFALLVAAPTLAVPGALEAGVLARAVPLARASDPDGEPLAVGLRVAAMQAIGAIGRHPPAFASMAAPLQMLARAPSSLSPALPLCLPRGPRELTRARRRRWTRCTTWTRTCAS